jgi:hypothetical protein
MPFRQLPEQSSDGIAAWAFLEVVEAGSLSKVAARRNRAVA